MAIVVRRHNSRAKKQDEFSVGIGQFRDDPKLLRSAINYLTSYSEEKEASPCNSPPPRPPSPPTPSLRP